jgi:hypothetical protein
MIRTAIDHQELSVDVMVDENAYQDPLRDGDEVRYMTRIGSLTITGFWPRPLVRVRWSDSEIRLQGMRMVDDGRWVLLTVDPAVLFTLAEFTPDPDYLAAAGIGVD